MRMLTLSVRCWLCVAELVFWLVCSSLLRLLVYCHVCFFPPPAQREWLGCRPPRGETLAIFTFQRSQQVNFGETIPNAKFIYRIIIS